MTALVDELNRSGQLAIYVGLYAAALLVGVPIVALILGRVEW